MAQPEVKLKVVYDDGRLKVGVAKTKADIASLGTAGRQAGREAAAGLEQINSSLTSVQNNLATVGKFAGYYLGFQGIKAGIQNLVDAQIALQQIRYGLDAATGSAQAGAREFEFLSNMAERVGVRLVESGSAYANFLASAKAANVSLATSRSLFSAVAEAGAVFNLSAGQMNSAMLGLTQAMSMGEFRAQELRQQIGSQLPGAFNAFKQAYEKAFGDGTFEKALSEGLDVSQFSDMFAKAIRSGFRPEQLEAAANDLNSQLAKMQNAIVRFKASFTEGQFTEALNSVLGITTKVVNGFAALNRGVGPQVLTFTVLAASTIAFVRAANSGIGVITTLGGKINEMAGFTKAAQAASVIATSSIVEEAAAHNANAVAQLREAESAAALAAAKRQFLALQLASAEAEVASLRSRQGSAIVSAELAAAEARLATVKAAEAQASQAQAVAQARVVVAKEAATVASVQLATAETSAAVATTRFTGAMGLARGAAAGLAVAGRGLLALLGGLPGVLVAVGAGLVYLATRSTDAEERIAGLREELASLGKQLANLSTGRADFNKATQELIAAHRKYVAAPTEANRQILAQAGDTRRKFAEALAAGESEAQTAVQTAIRARYRAEETLTKMVEQRNKLQADYARGQRGSGGSADRQDAGDLGTLSRIDRLDRGIAKAKAAVAEAQRKEAAARAEASSTEYAAGQRLIIQSKAREDAAKQLQAVQVAAQEAVDKKRQDSLTLQQRINEETEKEVQQYRKNATLAGDSPEVQAAAIAQIKKNVALRINAEETAKKAAGGGKSASAALSELNQDNEERKRTNEEVSRSLEEMAEKTREATDAIREDDPIRDKLEQSLRDIDRQYEETAKTLEESKLTDQEKAAQLQSIADAANAAKVAVRDLAAVERQRKLDALVKESQTALDDERFNARQEELRRAASRGIAGSQDQADKERIDAYYAEKLTELDLKFGPDVGGEAYMTALNNMVQAHQLALQTMSTEAQRQGDMMEQAWVSSFTNSIMGMLTGAMTLREGLSQIFMSIFQVFMQNMVVQPLAELAARFLRERVMHIGMATTQVATQTAASAAVVAAKSAETGIVASENAVQAGTGAAASQASIPYIGPILAIAAMAAIFAAVMGMAKRNKKRDGGQIRGPGTGTSDSVPIAASNGEYVIRASSVSKYGIGFLDAVNTGTFGMANPMSMVHRPKTRYADGGLVQEMSPGGVGARPPGPQNRIRVYVLQNEDQLAERMAMHPATEKAIVAIAGENQQSITADWS